MDDTKIKYIDNALWLKTIEHYPKTIGQIKLLISVLDRVNIFSSVDLSLINEMDGLKLNVIYAILRIMNKIYTKYIDYMVKKVFIPYFMEIFSDYFIGTDNIEHIFFDQLSQDMDDFISITINQYYPTLINSQIKSKLIDHVRNIFQKSFYKNIMKKIFYPMANDFFIHNNDLFQQMADDFILYSEKILASPYRMMKIFVEAIFNPNTKNKTIIEISNSLEKHINLPSLLKEGCLEIEIYSEQKINTINSVHIATQNRCHDQPLQQ